MAWPVTWPNLSLSKTTVFWGLLWVRVLFLRRDHFQKIMESSRVCSSRAEVYCEGEKKILESFIGSLPIRLGLRRTRWHVLLALILWWVAQAQLVMMPCPLKSDYQHGHYFIIICCHCTLYSWCFLSSSLK